MVETGNIAARTANVMIDIAETAIAETATAETAIGTTVIGTEMTDAGEIELQR
jgi:hypothetical protein